MLVRRLPKQLFKMQRDSALARLRAGDDVFDFLIIGGGASGLGAAVEAASRGHRVALIEQADFAKGTSSRSTKLVHGGVRYLKQGNLSLVRSALRERERLRHNAPHLVHSLGFVIPNYNWWDGPFYGFGMALYDGLAGRHSFGRSRRLTRAETIEHLPTIETNRLAGGVLYTDGQFDDARLALTLARTAVARGAIIANYCACVGLSKSGGRIDGARVRDVETGAEFAVRARNVINATGVFVDAVRRFDEAKIAPLVTVSQGVHIVLPREFLPGNSALMIPKTADGRVLFAIPWHGKTVVGTTDTPGVQPSLEPRALPAELDFILEHARHYLSKDPGERDVLSVFTGLRPLVSRGGDSGTAALSRDHTIATSASGLITLTGGKWTTYRKMAEDVVDHAEKLGGLVARPSRTAELRLHGAAAVAGLPEHLRVYGSDAESIARIGVNERLAAAPLHPALTITAAEVAWHARHEMARTVEDVLARRTRSLVLDARASIAVAPAVAQILARELRRDLPWAEAQVRAYSELARGWLMPAVSAATVNSSVPGSIEAASAHPAR
jgi:glycerol-3-phosphate dehydrogenase